MLKIENVEVEGFRAAIRGMRNPMNSWDKSDSMDCYDRCESGECFNPCRCHLNTSYCVGPDDMELMKKLMNAGTDHRKFMRMITVYLDITAPLYWWKEFDTYKVGTVANSCSTMHKIHAKEFTIDDFSYEHLISDEKQAPFKCIDSNGHTMCVGFTPATWLKLTIDMLNIYRKEYLETKDKTWWWQLIQSLPSSYNQKRTVMLNYEVLANICKSRCNHKLDEWHMFCDWAKTLPYLKYLIS